MFWIGAAPTVPGISARFSRPAKAVAQRPHARSHAIRRRRRRARCARSPSSSSDARRRAPVSASTTPVGIAGEQQVAAAAEHQHRAVAQHRVAEQFRQRRRHRRTSTSIGARAATPKVLRAIAAARSSSDAVIGERLMPCGGTVAAAGGFLAAAHRLDAFADQRRAAIDQAGVDLHQRRARRRSWSRRRRRTGCRPRRSAGSIRAGACAACAAPRWTVPISGSPGQAAGFAGEWRAPCTPHARDRGVGGDDAVDAAGRPSTRAGGVDVVVGQVRARS